MNKTEVHLREILFAMVAFLTAGGALRQRFYGICGVGIAALLAFGVGTGMESVLLGGGMLFQEAVLMASLFPALLFWYLQSYIRKSFLEGDDTGREKVLLLVLLTGCGASVCFLFLFQRRFQELIGSTNGGIVSDGIVSDNIIRTIDVAAFLICCLLCAAAFAACLLYRRFAVSVREEKRLRTLIKEEEYRQRQKQEILAVSGEVRKLRHDMKNSCQLLYGLLERGSVKEAMDYLSRETRQLPDIPLVIYTGSEAVNTLISQKQAQAKAQGILFTTKIETSPAGIEDYDICRLLGNLLDNALEAVLRCEKGLRRIDLKLYGDGQKCLLEVVNVTAGKVLENGRLPATTKGDFENHGFGYLSVTDIVEKYNGSVRFSETGEQLRTSVILFRSL